MPAFPRSHYVDEHEIGTYHAWSRCVQRAYLCGQDPLTGEDYNHRRDWIESLLEYQAGVFAVDLGNYNILANHQHLLVRNRPDLVSTWSDEECAWRWKMAWPNWDPVTKRWEAQPSDGEIRRLLAELEHLAQIRRNLASLSWFLARVKEPIAKLANAEMDRTGHFFEGRFKCRKLEDPPAVLTCSVYIDVNQIAAGMAQSLIESQSSAIRRRLAEWLREQAQQSLEEFNKYARPDLKLELDDVLRLLNGHFLAPISEQGPLILVGDVGTHQKIIVPDDSLAPLIISGSQAIEFAAGELDEFMLPAADAQPGLETTAACEAHSSPQPPVETPSLVATASAPENSARQPEAGRSRLSRFDKSEKPSHPPTYEIHRRLKARQRARATDNPILDLPSEQYVELTSWSAARLLGSTSDMPASVAALLGGVGIHVARWLDTIRGFQDAFHSAVGSVSSLQAFIHRAGRKFIHGLGACRSAFT